MYRRWRYRRRLASGVVRPDRGGRLPYVGRTESVTFGRRCAGLDLCPLAVQVELKLGDRRKVCEMSWLASMVLFEAASASTLDERFETAPCRCETMPLLRPWYCCRRQASPPSVRSSPQAVGSSRSASSAAHARRRARTPRITLVLPLYGRSIARSWLDLAHPHHVRDSCFQGDRRAGNVDRKLPLDGGRVVDLHAGPRRDAFAV